MQANVESELYCRAKEKPIAYYNDSAYSTWYLYGIENIDGKDCAYLSWTFQSSVKYRRLKLMTRRDGSRKFFRFEGVDFYLDTFRPVE